MNHDGLMIMMIAGILAVPMTCSASYNEDYIPPPIVQWDESTKPPIVQWDEPAGQPITIDMGIGLEPLTIYHHRLIDDMPEYPVGSYQQGIAELMQYQDAVGEYAILTCCWLNYVDDEKWDGGVISTPVGDIAVLFNRGVSMPPMCDDIVLLKAFRGTDNAYLYDIMSGQSFPVTADTKKVFEPR